MLNEPSRKRDMLSTEETAAHAEAQGTMNNNDSSTNITVNDGDRNFYFNHGEIVGFDSVPRDAEMNDTQTEVGVGGSASELKSESESKRDSMWHRLIQKLPDWYEFNLITFITHMSV